MRVRVGPPSRGAAIARIVEVLESSPHRVRARCPHFGPDAEPGPAPCGGCTWQHIAYPEQLRIKTAMVDRLIRAAVRGAPRAQPTVPSTKVEDPWGYRHKVHFVFANASGARGGRPRAVMGHYVRGSRRVIPVRECPVHDPRGNALAFSFGDACASAGVMVADESGRGVLQSVAIRVGSRTAELMATIVVTRDDDRQLRTATRRAVQQAIEPPTSLNVNLHPKQDSFIFGPETRRLSGPARVRELVAGMSFVISPTAFFQTNVDAAELMVRLVLEALPADGRVLDLYAGAGLFALPLARRGHRVIAVEDNPAAVADGEASQRLNRIPPDACRFMRAPVERALRSIRPADAELVVLDPPRDGCSPAVIDEVFGRLQPATAVYVSCNPETLARDLAGVTGHGYRIISIQPVDMFPHTAHIESVVVLTR